MRMDVTGFGIVLGVMALLASTAATDAGPQGRKHFDRRNLLASTAEAQAGAIPTTSLKAVDINGAPVTGDPLHIVAQRGDQITVELRIRDWATELPDGVRSYQARVQGRIGAVSGANGTILPLGWEAPPVPDVCTTNADCIGSFICRLNVCVLPDHDPRLGAFIDSSRSDFILTGFEVTKGVGTGTLDYLYFAVAGASAGQADPGFEMYGGTLILVVSDYACGTFVYGFNADEVFLVGPDQLAKATFTALEPLIIDIDTGIGGLSVGECPPLPADAGTDPPNCAVDAGIPHDPNDAAAELGIQTIEMTFDSDPSALTTADFEMNVLPFGGAPSVTDVTSVDEKTLRMTFSRIIDTNRYTCLRHKPSDRKFCWGYLPADSDASTLSETDDVLALMDNLDGMFGPPPMPVVQCDINRSGGCTPQDVLSSVNLLNGASDFDVWDGEIIGLFGISVECPSK